MPPFQFFDARAGSKRPKQSNDCVIRAISRATNTPYDQIYDDFKSMGRKCGSGTPRPMWKDYIKEDTTKLSFPAIKGQKRMNLPKFLVDYPKGGYIIQFAGHLSTVIDGVCFDLYRPADHRCIYAAYKINN